MSNRRLFVLVLSTITPLIVGLAGFATMPQALATLSNTKLSGAMPDFGDVSDFRVAISPDGRYAVYAADQETDGAFELWSVPTNGSRSPVRLSDRVPSGFAILDFAIAPDGERVVYQAIQDTTATVELYSVKISGGQSTRLNSPLVTGGGVRGFAISPDSRRVVYEATQDRADRNELYSVWITGGRNTKLNDSSTGVGEVKWHSSAISPDSRYVVYIADQDTLNVDELYSVPIGGGASTKLNDQLVSDGDVFFASISPDSTRVVYSAEQTTNGVTELYSAPIAANPGPRPVGDGVESAGVLRRAPRSIKLNSPLIPDGNVDAASALISADSTRVVYRADQQLDEVYELYSVPILGGSVIRLNTALVPGGNVHRAAISPDSSRVVYYANQQVADVFELFSVPMAGGPVVKLNGTPFDYGVSHFEISPNGGRVVYTAQETATRLSLYSVPIAGGVPLKLNGPAVDGFVGVLPLISADSNSVIYQLQSTIAPEVPRELYAVAISGGTPIRLHPPLLSGRAVIASYMGAEPRRVLYIADQERDDVFELYTSTFELAVATTSTATPANAQTATAQASITPTLTRTATSTPTSTSTPANAQTATAQASITPTLTPMPGEAPDVAPIFLPLLTK
jgi:Tol biopolymer transport system component